MNFQIVVGSTTDLPAKLAEKSGLSVIPFIFTQDGKDYYNYLDNREISSKDFFAALREGKMASTTQITTYRYQEAWEPFLQEGKDILYLCLSSALSKSYEQSVMAAEEIMEKYPERRVITIDSKSASLGQGILAVYAAKMRDQGKSLDEVAAYIQRLIPRLQHWVMVDDLKHLKRGGRASGTAAFVGSMLGVKPVLTVVDDGRLVPKTKVRGKKNALQYIIDQMVEQKVKTKKQTICIVHGDTPELARQLQDMIIAKFGKCEFLISNIGPVIGAHAGPGAIATMFLGAKRVMN
ncbi:MAG: DegV family protein [Clostridiales bacterium]|nr:DegV family protein [Clostridiales bacterium]